MRAITKIQIDGARLSKALAAVPRSRGMWIGGKEVDAGAARPFGEYKQSGLGREVGRNAVADYTEEKTIHMHNAPCTAW